MHSSPNSLLLLFSFVLLSAVHRCCGHHISGDVVEGLLFQDPRCREAVGRIVLQADGRCRCLECARWREEGTEDRAPEDTPDGSNNTTTPTLTLSLSETATLNTATETITSTEGGEAGPSTVPAEVLLWEVVLGSRQVGSAVSRAVRAGAVCSRCSLSTAAVGVATCSAGGSEVSLQLFPQADVEACYNAESNPPPQVPISLNVCTRLPASAHQYHVLFAVSTCQPLPPERDTSITSAETVILVLLLLFLVCAAGAAAALWKVRAATPAFRQLRSDLDRSKKEQKEVASGLEGVKGKLEKQGREAAVMSGKVGEVTGNPDLSSGVLSAATVKGGGEPPPVPIREELDRLTTEMAFVVGELQLQQRMQLDAERQMLI